jgi:hypothetical protein
MRSNNIMLTCNALRAVAVSVAAVVADASAVVVAVAVAVVSVASDASLSSKNYENVGAPAFFLM